MDMLFAICYDMTKEKPKPTKLENATEAVDTASKLVNKAKDIIPVLSAPLLQCKTICCLSALEIKVKIL